MSKFTQCALAGAIALAVSSAAMAAGRLDVTSASQFAKEVTGGTGVNPTADAGTFEYRAVAPDILIGRTAATGQVTVSATIVGAKLTAAPATPTVPGDASVVGSVSYSDNSFQFVILPPTTGFPNSSAGSIFSIAGLDLESATGLQAAPNEVSIVVAVQDTTTGLMLSQATLTPVLKAVPATTTASTGNGPITVDVLAPASKRQFLVGSPGVNQAWAQIGTVTVGQADVDPDTGGTQVASVAGTGATTNDSNGATAGGTFVYDTAADTVKISLTVPQTGAFTGAGKGFYATQGACAASYTAGPTTIAFTGSGSTLTATAPISNTSGVAYNICAIANGTTEIEAQTIVLNAQVDLAGALTVDPAPAAPVNIRLQYNGAVVKVYHFNPASNASQESYLRVTNTSSTAGNITVDAICDDGAASPGQASLNLGAGKSILLTSADLQNGNTAKGVTGGLGACTVNSAAGVTGKQRLTLTGEFGSMQVQNFLRNVTSAGLVNTNVNLSDSADKQAQPND